MTCYRSNVTTHQLVIHNYVVHSKMRIIYDTSPWIVCINKPWMTLLLLMNGTVVCSRLLSMGKRSAAEGKEKTRRISNPKITYPPDCKELSDDLSNDELVKRLKVSLSSYLVRLFYFIIDIRAIFRYVVLPYHIPVLFRLTYYGQLARQYR